MLYKSLLFIVLLFFIFSGFGCAQEASLSPQEIQLIGNKVFANECASRDEYLLSWNEGEDFLSCGIGHFIWYPENRIGPFEESFPRFVDYAKASGAEIPEWLNATPVPPCPWVSRDEFFRAQDDIRVKQLREFLVAAKQLQAEFIVKRLQDSLALMLKNSIDKDGKIIRRQFDLIASTPSGLYALADYINFKGLGIFPTERYQGKGWGLLQVLLTMESRNNASAALESFVKTAKQILADRVNNAPEERNEKKWLAGWQNRVNSYLKQ